MFLFFDKNILETQMFVVCSLVKSISNVHWDKPDKHYFSKFPHLYSIRLDLVTVTPAATAIGYHHTQSS